MTLLRENKSEIYLPIHFFFQAFVMIEIVILSNYDMSERLTA